MDFLLEYLKLTFAMDKWTLLVWNAVTQVCFIMTDNFYVIVIVVVTKYVGIAYKFHINARI